MTHATEQEFRSLRLRERMLHVAAVGALALTFGMGFLLFLA